VEGIYLCLFYLFLFFRFRFWTGGELFFFFVLFFLSGYRLRFLLFDLLLSAFLSVTNEGTNEL